MQESKHKLPTLSERRQKNINVDVKNKLNKLKHEKKVIV